MKNLLSVVALLVAASSAQADRLMTEFTWDLPVELRPRGPEPAELDSTGWVRFSHPDYVPLRRTHATAYDPVHDRVYMIGGTPNGHSGSNVRLCQRYDPGQDTWELLAYMPEGRGWIGAGLVRGRIYVPCGYTNYGTASNSLFMYDIAADSWAFLSLCPRATCAYQIAVWRDSLIYMMGGINPQLSASVRDVDVYDPATGVWRSATRLPYGIDMGSGAVIGDTIYITNGHSRGASPYKFVDSLIKGHINPADPTQVTWTVGPELPCPFPDPPRGIFLAGTAALGCTLYWGGGNGCWTTQQTNWAWSYDPATGLIDTIHSLPDSLYREPQMLVGRPPSGELYIVSGHFDTAYYRLRVTPAPDVGPVKIVVPSGGHAVGDTVRPRVVLRNHGNRDASFSGWMVLFDPEAAQSYAQMFDVDSLAAGADTTVTLPAAVLDEPGWWRATCWTMLPGDERPENDTLSVGFLVGSPDVAAVALLAPTGRVDTMMPVVPLARARNVGNAPAGFTARFRILGPDSAEAYRDSVAVAMLPVGRDTVLEFAGWVGTRVVGPHLAECRVATPGDTNPTNDVVAASFLVVSRPDWPPGWVEVRPMPGPPTGRPVRRGGWLAYNAGNELVYAAKGNKTGDFYCYEARGDIWTTLAPIPFGLEGKPVDKGGCGAADGEDWVYAVKGANTFGFHRYSIEQDTWYQLPDVPAGPSGKKVKGGSDLVFISDGEDGYVYFMKGYRTEFWRYDPATVEWEQMADMPAGVRAKWNRGSWLAWDGGDHVWAHKAKHHELWRYDVGGDSWFGPFAGMPFIGQSGRRKKSKDGGAGDHWSGRLYALKGGNTTEYWCYIISEDRWVELEPMPEIGSTGKRRRVKHGGDFCSWTTGAFFALKGSKTHEFWRYVLPTGRAAGPQARTDVAAGGSGSGDAGTLPTVVRGELRLGPSPGPDARSVLLDAGGRLVMTVRSGANDVRHLTPGVYFLRSAIDDRQSEIVKVIVTR